MYEWYVRAGETIYSDFDGLNLVGPLKDAPHEFRIVPTEHTGRGSWNWDWDSGARAEIKGFRINGHKFYAWAYNWPTLPMEDKDKKDSNGSLPGSGLGIKLPEFVKSRLWIILALIGAWLIFKRVKK